MPARQAESRRNLFRRDVRELRVRIDTGKVLRLVTNDLASPVEAIEPFFRWVKQTLRIRKFLGTSEDAVRIQPAVALIAFLLLGQGVLL